MRYASAALILVLLGACPLRAQTRCAGGAPPLPDYGISLGCSNCTIAEFGQAASWQFTSEPRVTAVHPKGAAAGALHSGDEIVRVNGYPITTSQGAAAFATPVIGRTVVFTVRRDGSLRTAQVRPAATCPETSRSTAAVAGGTSLRAGQAVVSSHGWLGIGFGCSHCEVVTDADGRTEWRFSTPPEIYSIDASSPAYRAGLRRGDVVTHLDDIDVTTPDGARRLTQVRPGERVRIAYRRAGRASAVAVRAAGQPLQAAAPRAAVTAESEARMLIELQQRISQHAERLAAESDRRTEEKLVRRLRAQAEAQGRALSSLQAKLRRELSAQERRAAEQELRALRETSVREHQHLLNELATRQQEEMRRIQEMQRELSALGGLVPLVAASESPSRAVPAAAPLNRLSYSGSLGGSDVEVRGPSPVVVSREGDVITIVVGENTVKITQRARK